MTPRKTAAAWAFATVVAAAWALRPLHPAASSASVPLDPVLADAAMATVSAVDIDAFRTPLWTAPRPPPPPPAPPTPLPPVPPTRLKLLAIVTGIDGIRRATLYDPDSDRVESVPSGERCGTATVEAVGVDDVTVTDAGGTRTLRLRPDEPVVPSTGGGK